MDTNRDTMTSDDLSSLAWVQEELRKSLETAHKALRRFLKESAGVVGSDVDAVDPSVLRTARQQLHQGVGALDLVGMPAAAALLRASESAVQRIILKPQKLDSAAVDTIERASFGLLDYLARVLAGRQVSAVALFPQYRSVQELAGADRIHPADLWNVDWRWAELPASRDAAARVADEGARSELERLLLLLMRNVSPPATAAQMSDLCAGLGISAPNLQASTFWKLSSAFFEAQSLGLIKADVYSKRAASRVLAQFGMLERGESAVSDRLAQDLLFFCAQCALRDPGAAPRLVAVRQVYGLDQHVPVDYETSHLGRFDPALLTQARKRVVAAKDSWSAVAGGEMHRLASLNEQFSLVADSLRRIYPAGDALGDALLRAAQHTVESNASPAASLAMEVATSVLYLEASLEDVDFDQPGQETRTTRLAQRIVAVRRGQAPEPLEPWMEDLYRRVSDRQTMGSVVQELRSSLTETEKHIDQFFRNPADRTVLMPVPGQLTAMRGVLSVLGMDQASQAVLRMRDMVDELIATEVDPVRASTTGTFDRLAGNLGALGFLIDMLSYQPQMAKSLFAYDAASGELKPVMGRTGAKSAHAAPEPVSAPVLLVEPRLIEQAQTLAQAAVRHDVSLAAVSAELHKLSQQAEVVDQPALAASLSTAQQAVHQVALGQADPQLAREQVAQAMADFVATASEAVGLEPEPEPAARYGAAPAAAAGTRSGLEEDDEMRAIFLEEAQEVMGNAGAALDALVRSPDDIEQLTTVRRSFHTLKGSSRMVGLNDFGEAAWACEQLYNSWLAEQKPANDDLREFTADALEYLAGWIGQIASGVAPTQQSGPVRAAADAMRTEGRRIPVNAPDAPPAATAPAALPVQPPAPPAAPVAEPLLPSFELHFELDDFEGGAAAPAATANAPAGVPASSEPPPVQHLDLEIGSDAFEVSEVIDVSGFDLGHPDSGSTTQSPPAVQPPSSFDFSFDLNLEAPSGSPEKPAAPAAEAGSDQVKVVGPLRIGIPLFNIYLTEADELSRRLTTELAEWAMELHRPVGEHAVALAHSLAGSSSTVGFADLSHLARQLEHALMRSQAIGQGTIEEARLFADVAEEVRRLLHQFAAGFLKEPAPELLERLSAHDIESARQIGALNARRENEGEAVAEEVHHADVQPAALAEELPVPEATLHEADSLSVLGTLDLGKTELKALPAMEARPEEAHHVTGLPGKVLDIDDDIDAVDAVDADLFPIFEEEALELLPQLAGEMRAWLSHPAEHRAGNACMRTLHTFKGGARLAGAMRLGELAHRLETSIERLLSRGDIVVHDVEPLEGQVDVLNAVFEALRTQDAQAYADATAALRATPQDAAILEAPPSAQPLMEHVDLPVEDDVATPQALPDPQPLTLEPAGPQEVASTPAVHPASAAEAAREIDWSRFAPSAPRQQTAVARAASGQAAVRVRSQLLDRMVNQAGEVSITRARLESEVGHIKGSLTDLTDNLERLRQQLRDIELQAETQMSSRMERAKAEGQSFDPLEFDRFTRFQELTRMMAESVNDVATVQRTLQRTLETTEDELAAQARLTRELQDDLLRTRMVEFEGLSERLYRVVRLAAKETGKQVRLDIAGGSIEVDRGVLERMTASFEHLLRNCVTHGIEPPEVRAAAGKPAAGTIVVSLHQEGNEVSIEFRDDGAGLNLAKIRQRGVAMGLLGPDARPEDAELANLIFTPGFSTADVVTELAGRGVGMDVVRSDVIAMGGRIETATTAGQGTSFRLILPLTTAVTQVVMLRCGQALIGVPANLIEIVRRGQPAEVAHAYETSVYTMDEQSLPFFWLGALLQSSGRAAEGGRTVPIVLVRSAQQRIALHVDEVLGNQEVVVKNLGPQLSRLPGLAGMTLLASGAVALIYNPVALATLYGDQARALTAAALQPVAEGSTQVPQPEAAAEAPAAPLVLVVDDSLTVRRVTQRLLVREGYRVTLAKDGLDALERLTEERPTVILSDIEMPRMDGFDLVRNIRNDAELAKVPVIMITSRIAQKHRDYATELGVDHYLGKPYSEEELLALIGRYAMRSPEQALS